VQIAAIAELRACHQHFLDAEGGLVVRGLRSEILYPSDQRLTVRAATEQQVSSAPEPHRPHASGRPTA
jgi:hypothetical protein